MHSVNPSGVSRPGSLERPDLHVVHDDSLTVLAADAKHEAGFLRVEILRRRAPGLLALDARHHLVALYLEEQREPLACASRSRLTTE